MVITDRDQLSKTQQGIKKMLSAVVRKMHFLFCAAIISCIFSFATDAEARVTGNTYSLIFHKMTCRYAHCSNCNAFFDSPSEAKVQGYRPCKICFRKKPESSKSRSQERYETDSTDGE